jgi:hypothetical protein
LISLICLLIVDRLDLVVCALPRRDSMDLTGVALAFELDLA